jgi:MFS family permease
MTRPVAERLLTPGFLLCAAANLLQGTAFNLFVQLPAFLRDLGADEVQIGLLFGLTSAAAIAARPPLGRAMDLRGRRDVILLGGILNVVVCLAYLGIHALGAGIYAVRMAHGLAEAILFSAFFTQAADLVPAARRTEGLALFGVSGMLPISLGALLGDWILARTGFAALFLAAAALAGLSLLLSIPLRDARPVAGRETPQRRGFASVLLQRDLLPLWALGGVFATALAAVWNFLKLHVDATGVGSVGLFSTAYSLAAVALRLGLGWLPERVGPKRVLVPALATQAAGIVLLAQAGSAGALAGAGLLCGLGHGFTFPILSGMVVSRARESERGAALSLFTALFDAGVLVGGPLFGAVIEAAGFRAMYRAAAAGVVAGLGLFAWWDRQRR